mmetsp:Transcript_25977/g.61638  ORF Transcript_25977/g.61638 Transcript_25977/m.61638 type:complete len:1014 (-) Transcript_25977:1378-4419(-)
MRPRPMLLSGGCCRRSTTSATFSVFRNHHRHRFQEQQQQLILLLQQYQHQQRYGWHRCFSSSMSASQETTMSMALSDVQKCHLRQSSISFQRNLTLYSNNRLFSTNNPDGDDEDRNSSTTAATEPRKKKKQRIGGKKFTMRDFFANLDDTLNNSSRNNNNRNSNNQKKSQAIGRKEQMIHGRGRNRTKRHDQRRNQYREDQDQEATTTTTAKMTKRVNMGSFLQDVNSLMEEKESSKIKDSKSIHGGGGGRSSTTSSRSTTDSDDRPSIYDMMRHEIRKSDGDDRQNDSREEGYSRLVPASTTYGHESFQEYSELLDKFMSHHKFARRHTSKPLDGDKLASVVKWLQSPVPVVDCIISLEDFQRTQSEPDDGCSFESTSTTSDVDRAKLRSVITEQRAKFQDHLGWTKKQYQVAVATLKGVCNLCANQATAAPLHVVWPKLNEAGSILEVDLLHSLLYTSSSFSVPIMNRDRTSSGRGRSGGSLFDFLDEKTNEHKEKYSQFDQNDDEMDNDDVVGQEEEAPIDVASEVAAFHDILFTPTEQTTSISVRMLVSKGKLYEAEGLLDARSIDRDLRHRTYLPVFQAYVDERDAASAFRVFSKMKEGDSVEIVPETLVQLIACVAENGYFSERACPLNGADEFGYENACGPSFFDRLASELADNTLEITSASAKRLYNAFQVGFGNNDPPKKLRPLSLLESLRVDNYPVASDELVVSRVKIDESTGKCSKTGATLRLINLDEEQKQRYRDGLLYLTTARYQERQPTKADNKAEENLRRLGDWLEQRSDDPFTAIVDGPNVAFYCQNFLDGGFNYHQIQFVVDALEGMGEKVLVVLPRKYTQDSFTIQRLGGEGNIRQRLSNEEKKIRNRLIEDGKIYVVPSGNLDDFYWMYASVSMEESYVSPESSNGRFPGIRPMLISNDKLRDHRMSLLEPRLFRRWYSNFLVNFTFSAFVGGKSSSREIGFKTADIYSREIQGNRNIDDGDNASGSLVWHFPVGDWPSTDCLCVRIPATTMAK